MERFTTLRKIQFDPPKIFSRLKIERSLFTDKMSYPFLLRYPYSK